MEKRRIADLEARNRELTAELNDRDRELTKLLTISNKEQLPAPKSHRLEELLSSSLNKPIIQFLSPKELATILRLSKMVRSCILGTSGCVSSMLTSTVRAGLSRLKQYKKHVKYFETSC